MLHSKKDCNNWVDFKLRINYMLLMLPFTKQDGCNFIYKNQGNGRANYYRKKSKFKFVYKNRELINPEKLLYKAYKRVFGIDSGTWKALPKLDYILLFKTLYIKCEGCTLEDFDNDEGAIYQLSLVYNKNRKIII